MKDISITDRMCGPTSTMFVNLDVIMLVPVQSPSVVWWLACLPLDPSFAGSHPDEVNGFVMATKITAHLPLERNKAIGPRS
jgi:hypothetical protein